MFGFNYFGGYPPAFGYPCGYPLGFSHSWFSNSFYWHNTSYTPRQVISREPEFSARRLILDQFTGEYKVKERDGRIVVVGKFKITDELIIKPLRPNVFEGLNFEIEYDGEKYSVTLTFSEYCKRQLLPHLPFFKRNPDCKDAYIVAAVFHALQNFPDAKFLQIADRSGWVHFEDGSIDFASSASVFPGLEEYYPEDVKSRKLLTTDRALTDIIGEYRDVLHMCPELITLDIIRIHAIISRFVCPTSPADEAFVIKPAGEHSAKVAIACLKTKNYTSTAVCPLTAGRMILRRELDQCSDGVAVFRDTSLIEDRKSRTSSFEFLYQDLIGADGKETRSSHVIAIVEDNPEYIPANFPAQHLTLSDSTSEVDVKHRQKTAGEFDAALIRYFVNDSKDAIASLRSAADKMNAYPDFMFDSERSRTIRALSATAWFLKELGLLDLEDFNNFSAWLTLENVQSDTSQLDIINDFSAVVNPLITSGDIGIVSQEGPPYYTGHEFIVEKDLLSFESEIMDSRIIPALKTTRRRNIVLSTLLKEGILYCNNSYKRHIEVEVAPCQKRSVSVYSVTKSILNQAAIDKINERELAAFFMRSEQMHRDFMPVLYNSSGSGIAGVAISAESDVNRHQYVSGTTRSGKTFYLCQQAVSKARDGDRVIIFDHSGGFSRRELEKHLSSSVISKYVDFWDITERGLPVDFMNLDGCESLPEAKNQLLGILSSALRVTGDVQEKVLRRRISTFLKERGCEPGVTLGDILSFLDIGDQIQKKLYEKLFDVFDSIDGIRQDAAGWDQFFRHRKRIIVVSAAADSIHKSTHLMDMLLSSLFSYKQRNPAEKLTVVIDEVEDHFIATDSPIDTMLRKGGKHGLSLLLASQEFSLEKDSLGKLIGNCGTLIFFRPKSDALKDVAKITGFDTSTLAGLDQGECVAVGNFCDSFSGKNKRVALKGRTYTQEL